MGKPNYYAILTADVRYNNKLSSSEKLFYAEITSLTEMNGRCFASRKYFANLYGVSESSITSWTNKLAKHGLINVEYEYDGKQITRRFIDLKTPNGMHIFQQGGGGQKTDGGGQKILLGWSENLTDSINLTDSNNNNTPVVPKNKYTDEFEQVWVDYERRGTKLPAFKEWCKLTPKQKQKVKEHLPKYVNASTFKYRKYLEGYLSNEMFESQIQEPTKSHDDYFSPPPSKAI